MQWPPGHIGRFGTAAERDVGTKAGDVPLLDSSGALATSLVTPFGYINGYILSNSAGDPNHDIDVTVGVARSENNAVTILSGAAITDKAIDAAWAAGSAAGMLDTGAVANDTWYHIFAIKNVTTGAVDILASTSFASPTMPAGYTQKRRLGSVLTDGSANIILFSQYGDEFLWKDPPLDVDATNPGTLAVTRTLTVPTGLKVHAMINIFLKGATGAANALAYISSLDVNDEAVSATAAPLGSGGDIGLSTTEIFGTMQVRTNTSAQICTRNYNTDAASAIRVATLGWTDPRGKDLIA